MRVNGAQPVLRFDGGAIVLILVLLILARVFRARGYAIKRDVTFNEQGVRFRMDGWDEEVARMAAKKHVA